MTATHAIQPTFIINESDYKVKFLIEYSVYFIVISNLAISNNIKYDEQTTQDTAKYQIHLFRTFTRRTILFA